MKRSVNKILSFILTVYIIVFSCNSCMGTANNRASNITKSDSTEISIMASSDTEDSAGELDFIKSKHKRGTFFTNDTVLLYGGVTLILISIIGIVLTVRPKKNNRKNESIVNFSGGKRGKRGKSR